MYDICKERFSGGSVRQSARRLPERGMTRRYVAATREDTKPMTARRGGKAHSTMPTLQSLSLRQHCRRPAAHNSFNVGSLEHTTDSPCAPDRTFRQRSLVCRPAPIGENISLFHCPDERGENTCYATTIATRSPSQDRQQDWNGSAEPF